MSSVTWILCLILLTVLGENVSHGRHLKNLEVSDLEVDNTQKISAASDPVEDEAVGDESQGAVELEDIPTAKDSPVDVPPVESQAEKVEEDVRGEANDTLVEKLDTVEDEKQEDLMEVSVKVVMDNANKIEEEQAENVDQETVMESQSDGDTVKLANNQLPQKSPMIIPQNAQTEMEKSIPDQEVNKSRDNKVPLWYIGPVFAKESPSGRFVLPPLFSFSFPNDNPANPDPDVNIGNNIFTNFIRQQIEKLQAAVASLQGIVQG